MNEADEFLLIMRAATVEWNENSGTVADEKRPWWTSVFSLHTQFAAVGCTALALLVLLIPAERSPARVKLEAMRGPEALVSVPSSTPLDLHLSVRGLASVNNLQVEVVDAAGNAVYKTAAKTMNRTANAHTRPLAEGIYWVRLYSGAELLREYGFQINP